MAKFCENCGKELAENQDICLNCGVKAKNKDQKCRRDQKSPTGQIMSFFQTHLCFFLHTALSCILPG